MITPDEMKEIQNSGYSRTPDYEEEEEREEDYDEDEDDEDDDEDDERGGINTKLEKAMTIGGLIIGAVIICILIYFVASAAGIVGGSGSGQGNQTQQEDTGNAQEMVTVPALTNMTEDEARTALNNLSLGYSKGGEEASDTVPEGQVCRQDPAADTQVEPNTQVTYYVSTGPAEAVAETVTIPTGLIGQSLSQVQSQLQELGLNPVIEQQQSTDVAVGNVISLNPEEGATVDTGSDVTITVSVGEGDTMTRIPDVRGYEEAQAVQIVTDQGLIPDVEYSYSESAGVGYGQVYEMSPQGGQRIEQGSIITLRVLTEPEETDTQSDSTETSTETSESSGTWATVSNLKIGQPDNYEGQMVRLRLVQGSEDAQGGTTILQDQVLTFDENGEYSVGQITGQSGESTGTLYFDVMDESGNYTTIWSYPLEFSEQ